MNVRGRKAVGMLLLAALMAGCNHAPAQGGVTEPPLLQPLVPQGYEKIAPSPAESSELMLAQTATVFTGLLTDVYFTFDECEGPRTNYVFANSQTLLGATVQPDMVLKVLGGPTPEGRWLSISELPHLALGSTHVVFLRNSDWTYSPVLGDLVYRQQKIGQREVLVDPQGYAVTGWGPAGPRVSAQMIAGMVGQKRSGYRSDKTPRTAATPVAAEPEMGVEVREHAQAFSASDYRPERPGLITRLSTAEVRASGLFASPALFPQAISEIETLDSRALIKEIHGAARLAGIEIGGRIALDPYWNCWGTTRTQLHGTRQTLDTRIDR